MANGNGTGFFPDNPFPISTNYPKKLSGYWVSDERLEMLKMLRRDGMLEALWGCLGIFAGSLIPVFQTIDLAYFDEKQVALSGIELVQVIICSTSLVVALVVFTLWSLRGKHGKDIFDDISKQNE